MAWAPHRNLRLFGTLCGDKYMNNVVLLTTMWDKARSMEEAVKQEVEQKQRFWNAIIHQGATVGRFYADDPKSIWIIVDKTIQRHQLRQARLLQGKLVDVGKQFKETKVGKALFRNLEGLLNEQNRLLESLEAQVKGERADISVEAEMAAFRVEMAVLHKEIEYGRNYRGLKLPSES